MSDTSQTPSSTDADDRSLTGDVVEQGILKNNPQYHDDLRWWYRWAHIERKPVMSQGEASRELGIDGGTYSKVYRGEYKNAQQLVLPPPSMMLSRIRVMRQQERENVAELNKGRVMTPTVDTVWQVCRKAWRDRQAALLFGNTHIGKSEALKWFREENNHGATLYIDVQGLRGVQDVHREFVRALNLGADIAPAKLMPLILKSINKTNLILIDEFHHITYAYQKGSAIAMINAIKSIKDRTGCGMVICGTDVAREEFTEGIGKESKLLKQLWRRGVIKEQLPDALPVGDVRAFAKAYGLPFPAAPAKVERDLWANLLAEHPEFEAGKLCEDIAHNYGVLHLVTALKDAGGLAKKRNRELQWKDVQEVQDRYERSAAKKNV